MRIQHNLMAKSTNLQLGVNQNKYAKSVEKLSTGYRISRAADDAAGLIISEKMRSQIRGLNCASKNIQDGISLIHLADGALQETLSILQRMRELSVQAANDTYTNIDRTAVQKEMDHLRDEVDQVANHTEFNNGIYPLLGAGKIDVQTALSQYLKERTHTFTATKKTTFDGKTYQVGDTVTVTGVWITPPSMYNNVSISQTIFLCGTVYTAGPTSSLLDDASVDKFMEDKVYTGTDVDRSSLTLKDFGIDKNGEIYFYRNVNQSNNKCYIGILNEKNLYLIFDRKHMLSDTKIWKYDTYTDAYSSLWIQAGANARQGIDISLVDGTTTGLGLDHVSVLSHTEANNAIQMLSGAISQLNIYRSDFGAQQNRLEHMVAVNDNTAENLQVSESGIRDVNISDEMVKYIKQNILSKIDKSILAQANQSAEGVLALLQ